MNGTRRDLERRTELMFAEAPVIFDQKMGNMPIQWRTLDLKIDAPWTSGTVEHASETAVRLRVEPEDLLPNCGDRLEFLLSAADEERWTGEGMVIFLQRTRETDERCFGVRVFDVSSLLSLMLRIVGRP